MLNFLKLDLDGWLSYDKESIDLTETGITRICGSTGSGKSALLEAIIYLLFGNTLRDKSSVEDLQNKLLNSGYDISLEFEIEGVWHKIQEIRGREGEDLYFWLGTEDEDGDLRGKTKLETRKKISSFIGMSMDEFVGISVLGQRTTQTLITGTSGERAKLVTAIFGLEKYDQYIKDSQADLKDTKSKKEDLASRIEEYKRDLEEVRSSLTVNDLEPVTHQDIGFVKKKIEKIEEKLEKLRQRESAIKQNLNRHEEIERKKKKLERISQQIIEIEEKIEKVGEKIKKAPLDTINEKLEALRSQRMELSGEIKRARADLTRLKKTKECPITHEKCPVDVPEKHFSKIESEANEKISANRSKLEKVEKNIGKGDLILEKIKDFNNLTQDLESKKELLEFSEEEADSDLPPVDEILECKEKCKVAMREGKEKLSELRSEKDDLLGRQAAFDEREKLNNKVEEALSQKQEKLKDFEEKLKNASEELIYIAGALNIFRKAKVYKIDLVLELLNQNLDDIMSNITSEYKAKIVSEKKSSNKKKSLDKIDILVYNGSVWLPIGMTSGGQVSQVGLAVLMSIWKTSNGLSRKGISTLWLDEVFGPLSKDVIDEIFNSIVELSKEIGASAIKLISHRELDSRNIDHAWNVERIDGISRLV